MALFHVRMDVNIPRDLDPEVRAETIAKEKAYSQELQRPVSGPRSGASSASTATSPSSTWTRPTSCTRSCSTFRCSRTWTSRSWR